MKSQTREKYERLLEYLKEQGPLAVAFSSGVDSTLLLRAAFEMLGNRIIAVTAMSRSFPERESSEAAQFCTELGIRQIRVEVDQLGISGFRDNPADRCYICKKELFTGMMRAVRAEGFTKIAEGSNMDDLLDYRPGRRAVAELGVLSPLQEVGLTKAEIREISKELGLPTWKKQSFACLATRFAYGESITDEKLVRVDRAEQILIDLGFHQIRVRIHGEEGKLARIEVMPEEFEKLLAARGEVTERYRALGFDYVSMDLSGYVTGSMNKGIRTTQ